MHQCDYCCWWNPNIGCEVPYRMKASACKKAIATKDISENREKEKQEVTRRNIEKDDRNIFDYYL